MSEIIVAGIGQISVGEHWDLSLRTMAARAISAALNEPKPDLFYAQGPAGYIDYPALS